jgi:uncharacterized repeat protein (TIGR01451 family)
MRTRRILLSILSVLTLILVSFAALPASQAGKPSGGGTSGGNLGIKIQGFDKLSNSWTPGNTGGYAETQSIPFRIILTGSGSLTTLQIVADHFRDPAPGIEDLNNFRICTGAPVAGNEGATGCTTLPLNAPTQAGGPYVTQDVPDQVVSGVVHRSYTFHNITVPSSGIVLLWGAELALGSHLYPGSALHMAIGTATAASGTISFGSKDVPIPVNQILATETIKLIDGKEIITDATIGDILNVSITGKAFGPSKGTQTLTITDKMSEANCIEYVAGSGSAGVVVAANGDLSWTFTDVKNGTTRTVTFQAKVISAGSCLNVATTHSPLVPVDSEDSVPITAKGVANLSTDKDCTDTVGPGEVATCTITYQNTGSEAAPAGTVTDVLEQGLVFVAGTPPPASVTTDPQTGKTTVVWNTAPLAVGSDPVTITYGERVPATGPAGTAHFADTATTFIPGDGNPDDDSDTEIVDVTYTPDLDIDKDCPDTAPAGGQATFTINYGNSGSAGTGTTTIVDTLPSGLTYASSSLAPSSVSADKHAVTWTLTSLAAGATGSLTLTADVAGGGSFTNLVTISATGTSDQDSCSTNLAYTDPSIAKDCGGTTGLPNGTLTHTLTFGNSGNQAAANVVITDTLDNGLTKTAAAPTYTGSPTPTFSQNGQVLTWTFASLPAGASGTIQYVVRIANLWPTAGIQNLGDSVTITTTSSNQLDPNNDNSDSCSTAVDFEPHLTLTKSGCRQVVVPGGFQTYTLTYANDGHAPATNVDLVDSPPASQPIASAPGATSVDTDTNTATWHFDSVAVGPPASKTLTVQVNADEGAVVSNTATISGDPSVQASSLTTTAVSGVGRHSEADAYAVSATLLSGLPAIPVTGYSKAESPGGPTDAAAAGLPPLNVPGLLSAQLLTTTSHAETGIGYALSTATSEVAGVNVTGVLTAGVIRGQANAIAGPQGASANGNGTWTNLVIPGVSPADLVNVAPSATGTVVLNTLLAKVTLNKVTKTAFVDGTGRYVATVDVDPVTVELKLTGTKIVIGHAHAEAQYPNGLACGVTPSTVSARAYTAHVTALNAPTPVIDLTVNDAEITPFGGSEDANAATVNVPGVLSAGAVINHAQGSIGTSPTAQSHSNVANLNLGLPGLTITATAIDVTAASHAGGGSASTAYTATFLGLGINGTGYTAPLPNQVINILPPDGSLIHIVLNEQITGGNGTTDTEGTVNAIHITVFNALQALTTDVIVASAHSDAHVGG